MAESKFTNLINFRQIKGTKIYRCARPDDLTAEEIKMLDEKYAIKSFFDFRAAADVSLADTSGNIKPFNLAFIPYQLDFSSSGSDIVQSEVDHKDKIKIYKPTGNAHGNHFFMNIVKSIVPAVTKRMTPAVRTEISQAVNQPNTQEIQASLFTQTLAEHGHAQEYKDYVDYGGDTLKLVLRMLSKPEHVPGAVNCTLGKDRTGVMAALLHGILGSSRQEIIDDYMESAEGLASYKQEIEEILKLYGVRDMAFGEARRDYIEDLLDHMDKVYESIPKYLEGIGFSMEEQEQLRRNILA